MKKRTALIFYVLSIYVLIQFIWWGYHIIQLTQELPEKNAEINQRVVMIMGEGAVFLLILLVGIWQIRRSMKKEIELSKRQNNFLLSVTHELKTPLAANKLYIQTVQKRELKKEQINELLDKSLEENERLSRMIDNILNASQFEQGEIILSKEKITLWELATKCQNRFQSLFQNYQINVNIDKKLIILADKHLIASVLSNLVENAIKYAGENRIIEIYGRKENHQIIWGIKDNGNGVSNSEKKLIFNKFHRSGDENTRNQKGSGLGLYIVKQIIELHDATIECLDNPPQGANFQITWEFTG